MSNTHEHQDWKLRTRDEQANFVTHLIGTVAAVFGTWPLVMHGFEHSQTWGVAMLVFALGIVLLYLFSTLYHWVLPGKSKRVFRHFDHASIYVLIAASYTPIWLGVVGGTFGWVAFGLLWGIALGGIVSKIIALGKYPRLSLAVYLVMGWSVLFAIKPVWQALTTAELLWIFVEGILYSAGTYFFAHDDRPYFHAIWHLFVIGGTLAHAAAMWLLVR